MAGPTVYGLVKDATGSTISGLLVLGGGADNRRAGWSPPATIAG